MPGYIEIIATALFAIAIIHTFSVPVFARLANRKDLTRAYGICWPRWKRYSVYGPLY